MKKVKEDILEHFAEAFPERENEIEEVISNITKEVVRSRILNEGNGLTAVPLQKSGLIIRSWFVAQNHGSGLFERGQTQVLTVCTLGAKADVQVLTAYGKMNTSVIFIIITFLHTV